MQHLKHGLQYDRYNRTEKLLLLCSSCSREAGFAKARFLEWIRNGFGEIQKISLTIHGKTIFVLIERYPGKNK